MNPGCRKLFSRFAVAFSLAAPPPAAAFAGTEGASFLDIPVGAGPAALGTAYTALAMDAYAPVYNPAGLAFLDATSVAGQHLEYVSGINYEFLSAVRPMRRGGLGLAVRYLGTEDAAEIDETGREIGQFSDAYNAVSLAWGREVWDRTAVGLTGTWIRGRLANETANAFAADVGALFRASERLSLSAVVANAGTNFRFINQPDPLPLAFKAGAAWSASTLWTVAAEGQYTRSGLASLHGGFELRPSPAFALRLGYRTDTLRELSALAGLTLGAAIHFWNQEFAYAWRPLGDLGHSNYFSLVLHFGVRDDEPGRRNLRRFARAGPYE